MRIPDGEQTTAFIIFDILAKKFGKQVTPELSLTFGLNVARGWEGLEGRTGKLTFLSST